MSKNFEEEYKAYIEEIKPDLWARIESQLPEKKTVNAVEIQNQNIQNIQDIQRKKKTESKHKVTDFFKKYGGYVAACAVVAILVPTLALNRDEASKDNSAKIYGNYMTAQDSNTEKEAEMVKASIAVTEINGEKVVAEVVSSEDLQVNDKINCTLQNGTELEVGKTYDCEISKYEDGTYVIINSKEK